MVMTLAIDRVIACVVNRVIIHPITSQLPHQSNSLIIIMQLLLIESIISRSCGTGYGF